MPEVLEVTRRHPREIAEIGVLALIRREEVCEEESGGRDRIVALLVQVLMEVRLFSRRSAGGIGQAERAVLDPRCSVADEEVRRTVEAFFSLDPD